ncbi:hypothetical protein [Domibacillus antri]|uniref:hypothetical protein n=1 Tax=Domibacillus antri TaxID=1714264 RepID=UPI0011786D57|nr:hypothetical protein [Domibacillus antri]
MTLNERRYPFSAAYQVNSGKYDVFATLPVKDGRTYHFAATVPRRIIQSYPFYVARNTKQYVFSAYPVYAFGKETLYPFEVIIDEVIPVVLVPIEFARISTVIHVEWAQTSDLTDATILKVDGAQKDALLPTAEEEAAHAEYNHFIKIFPDLSVELSKGADLSADSTISGELRENESFSIDQRKDAEITDRASITVLPETIESTEISNDSGTNEAHVMIVQEKASNQLKNRLFIYETYGPEMDEGIGIPKQIDAAIPEKDAVLKETFIIDADVPNSDSFTENGLGEVDIVSLADISKRIVEEAVTLPNFDHASVKIQTITIDETILDGLNLYALPAEESILDAFSADKYTLSASFVDKDTSINEKEYFATDIGFEATGYIASEVNDEQIESIEASAGNKQLELIVTDNDVSSSSQKILETYLSGQDDFSNDQEIESSIYRHDAFEDGTMLEADENTSDFLLDVTEFDSEINLPSDLTSVNSIAAVLDEPAQLNAGTVFDLHLSENDVLLSNMIFEANMSEEDKLTSSSFAETIFNDLDQFESHPVDSAVLMDTEAFESKLLFSADLINFDQLAANPMIETEAIHLTEAEFLIGPPIEGELSDLDGMRDPTRKKKIWLIPARANWYSKWFTKKTR